MKKCLIWGAGPSGLYTAKKMLRKFKEDIEIFLLEKSVLPGGLLRYGVAPDHPEIINTLSHFDDLFALKNVHLITESTHEIKDLLSFFDFIFSCTGCNQLRNSVIEGENLVQDSVVFADEIVKFYTDYYQWSP